MSSSGHQDRGRPMTERFDPNEAKWLTNYCEAQKQAWEKRCSNAASHADIARRDSAAAHIKRIEGIIDKITALTEAPGNVANAGPGSRPLGAHAGAESTRDSSS